MVETLFRVMGVNRMLDKQGASFEKLLRDFAEKQKKPLKVPYKKLEPKFELVQRDVNGTLCHVVRVKGANPKKAVLYLFGGGYILPPDPGDLILCGQIAEQVGAEVWFPLYPMAPEHRLIDTVRAVYGVYQEILKSYPAEAVRIFGTSSGGGLALSLCMYIRKEKLPEVLPGKLLLQSPGLQVPPSVEQRETMERRKREDVMIPPSFFDNIAPVLATGEETYLLSPLLFDLSGFPPMDVFYGTKEVMIAYLPEMQEVCAHCGVPLNVHIGNGMMHCWGAMEFVPEAKAVRQDYFEALR